MFLNSWISTVKNKLVNIYSRDDIELRHKLLIVLIIGIMFGDTVGTVFDFINGLPNVLFNVLLIVVCIVALVIAVKFKKYDLAANIEVYTIGLVVLPLMYFVEGGIHSGMVLWFLLSIIVSFLMLSGINRYITCSLEVLADITCFVIENRRPELVTVLDNDTKYMTDMISSYICVALLACSLILIHLNSYERARKKVQKQAEELLENKKMLEEAVIKAQAADRAKSDFLANMSHEIRTPINAVLGMDQMILRESNESNIREYASNIETSGKTLLSIINDILDFSKIEAGKMELSEEDYQISSVVNDVCNMIGPRVADKNLSFSVKNNPDIPYLLYGDEVRLKQAVLNLCTNAVKYTKEGEVSLDVDYSEVNADTIMLNISVSDTGIGIREENLPYLFEAFKRVDLKENRKIEGTGLGLAITHRITELMGGTIRVNSTYGKGSVFILSIPQRVSGREAVGVIRQQRIESKKTFKPAFTAPDANILVVDDVSINLKVFCGLLKETHMQIDMASSGEQCLDMVKRKHYDVIFMDHMMPGMDGVETFTAMKRLGNFVNRDTPVIILTANAIQGVKEMYMEAGFNDYVSKPVKYEILEKMLMNYLPQKLMQMDDASEK